MDPKEKELREKIKPIMESMVFQLVCERPDNAVKKYFNLGAFHDQLSSETR